MEMEDWEPNDEFLEAAQEKIEEIEARIRAEKEKVPSEKQWGQMTSYERRQWAKNATSEQREKIQYRE